MRAVLSRTHTMLAAHRNLLVPETARPSGYLPYLSSVRKVKVWPVGGVRASWL